MVHIKTYCTLDVVPFYEHAQVIHSFTSFSLEFPVRYHDLLFIVHKKDAKEKAIEWSFFFFFQMIPLYWANDFDAHLKNHDHT